MSTLQRLYSPKFSNSDARVHELREGKKPSVLLSIAPLLRVSVC